MTPLLALIVLQAPDAATVARSYVSALARGDMKTAAGLVQGGIDSNPARRLGAYLGVVKDGASMIRLIDVKAVESGDTATATVRIRIFQEEETSEMSLVRQSEGWRIVPQAVDRSKRQMLPALTMGFAQPMVFLAIVAPIEAQEKRHKDLQGIKQVGVAVLLWSMDHGDRFPKAGVDLATSLRPYVKELSLLERIKKKEWLFNDALRGRSVDMDDPSRVAMLYEAAGGKGLGGGRES